jgi:hypothetical protein
MHEQRSFGRRSLDFARDDTGRAISSLPMSRPLHLYALSRILAEPSYSFRLSEDLEVFDRAGNLIEAVYVESPGFLTRMRRRLREHPKATQRLLGTTQLSNTTLERDGFSRKQIDALREVLVTEEVQVEEHPAQLVAWLERERDLVSAADVRASVKAIEAAAAMDEVAAALTLAAVGIPSEVHVQAEDGWIARVDELRQIPHVRIHVTAEQAAWRRAEESGATLLWKNVDVTLVEPQQPREPETWSEAAAVLHTMLHRDVQRYLEENAELIADVLQATRAPELAWAALDPAGLGIIDVDTMFPEIARRRPKEAFAESRAWLAAQTQEWREPDWKAVSEISFWSKRWNLPTHEPDVAQFRRETRTASIADDGETVTAHWIAPAGGDFDARRETLKIVDGIRRLYPERRRFGVQIHGRVSGEFGPEEFPSPWLYWVHLLFVRPELTWEEYAQQVALLRTRVTALFARITAALTTWFRRDKVSTIFESGVSAEEWDAIAARLATLPKIPKTADVPDVTYALQKALDEWAAAVREFLTHSWRFFVANPQIGRGTPEGRERVEKWLADEGITRELPTKRLADAIRKLKPLQEEFAARFPSRVDETEERDRLWDLWAVWYDFAFYPRRKLANAVRDSKAAVDARIDERRRALRKRFRTLTIGKAEIQSERDGLWLTIDVEHVPGVVNAFAEALVQVIDVLHPPVEQHAFDRYVLDLVWQRVHLVPLVRGKSLERKQWSLEIATLPQPGEDLKDHAWKFVQHPTPRETWDALGLEAWPSNVATAARRLAPTVTGWRETLDHLVALREIPEGDPDVLVPHWREAAELAERQADEVLELLEQVPAGIFTSGDDAIGAMAELVRNVRTPAPETLVEARGAVVESLVPAAMAIGEIWIDRELP